MPEANLQRKLGLFPSTNIVVANMIGAGIFTTSGLLMAGLNNPFLMLTLWFAGGIIALCGALSYGELGAAMPAAGGGVSSGFAGWKTIGLSLMWIMFAYSGWNASTYIGAEIKNPVKTLPGSLILGTGIVILLYLAINILYVYGIRPAEMKGVISIGGLLMGKLFGQSADTLFSLLIAFALFSSLSAFIIIGPRVYYSMAKDGLFFNAVAKIHPKFQVPSNSIILQCAIAIVLTLSGTFEQILTYMGFALGVFPILTVAGVFKLRKNDPYSPRLAGYPYTQIIYITTSVLILVLAFMERPFESSIASLTVIAGIPAYYIFKARSRTNKKDK